MKITPFKAVFAGAAIGAAILIGLGAANLAKYVGQFYGDGSGLTNIIGSTSTAPVQNFYATNIFVTSNHVDVINSYQSNVVVIETNVLINQNFQVKGQATFNNFLVVSNGVQTASVPWAGPTNTLPLNSWRQHYTTFTPISVTGFTQKSTTNVQPFTLCILNAAATNVTFIYAAGIADLNYASTYTITNGTELIWAGEYDPYLTRSNALGRIAP